MLRPSDDGVEDGGGSVDEGKFIAALGEAAPLLDAGEASCDDVTFAVVDGIEAGWPAAA